MLIVIMNWLLIFEFVTFPMRKVAAVLRPLPLTHFECAGQGGIMTCNRSTPVYFIINGEVETNRWRPRDIDFMEHEAQV